MVLLIDEIDALLGDTLIAVLWQLRAGYANRLARFPQTVILCGVRDVRDYRVHSAAAQEINRQDETYRGRRITVWGC